jgi:hypothetical protein
MKAPLFFPLDAPKRAVSQVSFGQAIINHMHRKLAAQILEHAEASNRLASWPQTELPQTVPYQVSPTDPDCVPWKPHGRSLFIGEASTILRRKIFESYKCRP